MPIDLIPADNGETLVGETVSPEAPPEEPAVVEPTEVAVETPVKRGRGRPPGSRNKPKEAAAKEAAAKEAPAEAPPAKAPPAEPVERPPRAPRPIAAPPVEEESPKPVERRPRAPRKPREYVVDPESPPETPRSYRARVQREYREMRVSQHAERRDHYSAMLNRFMH